MALNQFTLRAHFHCCHVPMDGADLAEWLISHDSTVLTIYNEGSWANTQRYNMDSQIYGKDCSLTNNGRQANHTRLGLCDREERNIQPYWNDMSNAEDSKLTDKVDRKNGTRNEYEVAKVTDAGGCQDNGKKAPSGNKDKKVTFDPIHVGQDSSCSDRSVEGDIDNTQPKKSVRTSTRHDVEIEPSANNRSEVSVTSSGDTHARTSTIHHSSSETELSKESPLSRSASVSAKRGAYLRTTTELSRSASDRALSTLSPSTLASLEISRKDKKRRSIVKRKILKIQKAFKKKPTASLEESEDTGDYPPGSDDSEDISKASDRNNTIAFLNGREVCVDGRESPVNRPNQLKVSHSTSRTDSSIQHRSSCSSLDLDSPVLNGGSPKRSSSHLKSNATSPAALNTLTGTEGELSEDNSISPRLTPTSSNFDDSQLIGPSMGISYHPHTRTLRLQNDSMGKTPPNSATSSKQGSMRKKKRSGSWYNGPVFRETESRRAALGTTLTDADEAAKMTLCSAASLEYLVVLSEIYIVPSEKLDNSTDFAVLTRRIGMDSPVVSLAVIPTVTVTSSDDIRHADKEDDDEPEAIESESEKEWEMAQEENKVERPTHLPVQSYIGLRERFSIKTYMAETEERALSYPSTPVDTDITSEMGLLGLPRTKSASCLISAALLTPGTDSDRDGSKSVMSDIDDMAQYRRLKLERADSDPSEFSPRKRGKNVLRSFRKGFKSAQKKKDDTPIKIGVTEELVLESVKMVGISETPKTGKLKTRKSKEKRKMRFTKMAQKLSERQVLSPSYKQKNEDFHKFFKDLPLTERLLVDYACALVKDILIQGRVYVSQNYLCFHSNILKWQTAVTVSLVEIDQMTKEKTAKFIPNAIQVLMKDKMKMTFTSFTARDRAYLTIFRLWQNALLDKPISAVDLWSQIHRNYGEELGGCSSDDDYVRPKYMPRKHQSLGDVDPDLKYEFGTTNKVKKKKKSSNSTQTPRDGDFEKGDKRSRKSSSKSSRNSLQDSPLQSLPGTDSTGDDKSSQSSRGTQDERSIADEEMQQGDACSNQEEEKIPSSKSSRAGDTKDESDDEAAEFAMEDCAKVSMNRIYEVSARNLYRIIFSDDCPFSKDTLVNKGTTNITFGTWANDEGNSGQRIRELSYTLRLDNPIGPKTSFVKEKQIFYPCTVEGKTYVVDCFAQNYGIPYADYFQTCMRYCIRKVSKTSSELRVTSELRYKKTPWGLVKNFIEKNVASGLTENFRKLSHQIQDRIEYERSQPQLVEGGGARDRKNSQLRQRKRRSDTSVREKTKTRLSSSSLPLLQQESSLTRSSSDMNNNKSGNSSPEPMTGAPPLLPANGYLPNAHQHSFDTESPKLHYFGQGGKFIIGAILFIFVLLIYSNYSMYQRLTTLEQVTAAAATADGVDPSITAALLDRPGVPISSNPEILSTYLQAIDKRLRRLEDTVLKFTENSNTKWDKMEKNWSALHNMIQTIVKQQGADGT